MFIYNNELSFEFIYLVIQLWLKSNGHLKFLIMKHTYYMSLINDVSYTYFKKGTADLAKLHKKKLTLKLAILQSKLI